LLKRLGAGSRNPCRPCGDGCGSSDLHPANVSMFVCKYQTQSGRELRKPVEWLIAAIRATTIELQGSLRLLGCLPLKNEAARTGGRRPRSLGGGNRGPAWHVGAAPAAVIYGDLRSASDRMGCVRRGRWAKRGRKTAVEERGWTVVEVDRDDAARDLPRRSGHWASPLFSARWRTAAVGGIQAW
jgi:hypothetical protein